MNDWSLASSRSGSPSSRLGYHTYHMPESNSLAYQSRRVPPRSQGTSRETSPNRFGSKRSLENLFQNKRWVYYALITAASIFNNQIVFFNY